MQLTILKSKIHRATLTGANLDYEGSISIDEELLRVSGIYCNEQVHVVNVNNGTRLITYVIPAKSGSGEIALNGAAARLGMPGDIVIIIAYCNIDEDEAERHVPRIVLVDSENHVRNEE
ncbi:MAG: aspartate 1-decarboxylase [Chitinispirillaceae bacterium]|nr:aspartate 1-decarboxylase [Chitinispirillaceae bacterium]